MKHGNILSGLSSKKSINGLTCSLMLRKIVAIGPESTGKSTLCEQLARHYHTLWCPEYAREYLSIHGKKYNYNDLLIVAREQVKREEKSIQLTGSKGREAGRNTHHSLLFIDTNRSEERRVGKECRSRWSPY